MAKKRVRNPLQDGKTRKMVLQDNEYLITKRNMRCITGTGDYLNRKFHADGFLLSRGKQGIISVKKNEFEVSSFYFLMNGFDYLLDKGATRPRKRHRRNKH